MRRQPQPSTQQLGVVPACQQLPGRGLGSSVQPCSLSATSLSAPMDLPAHLVSLLGSFLPSQHKHLLFLATVSLGSIQTHGYPPSLFTEFMQNWPRDTGVWPVRRETVSLAGAEQPSASTTANKPAFSLEVVAPKALWGGKPGDSSRRHAVQLCPAP